MKKLLGVFVLVLAVIALLLATCSGPSDPDASGEESPTSAVAPVPRPDPAPNRSSSAAEEHTNTTVPGALDAESEAAREPAAAPTVPTGKRSEDRSLVPESPADDALARTIEFPSVAPLPPVSVPVEGVEALLAVDTRTLEGGTVPTAGILLVPVDTLRRRLRLPTPSPDWLPTDFTRGQPASTINTPTAYGQRWGQVSAGAAYQNRIRYDDWTDAVASVGFGVGNPMRYVGLDVGINILDTYTDFGEDRSLSLKLHRRLPFRMAVAVGHENIWHTDGTDGGSSRYLVVSKVVLLRDRPTAALGSMVLNLGIGNDRFLPEAQFARGEDGENVFGSLGVRVLPQVNAVANWTGQDLALGLSIAPVRTWPLVITPAVVDVTGTAGDGARFSVGAGLNYSFR